ncbi:MAG: serine hydrolase [Nitrospira sp.]|nr:serine hydrolase [Nitrospira sp.]
MRIIATVTVLALLLVGTVLHYVWELISIGAAYKAKILCSGVFVSMRTPEDVLHNDLGVDDLPILRALDAAIDRTTQTVSATFLGLIKQSAEYRPGLGCTLKFKGYKQPPLIHFDPTIDHVNTLQSQWPTTDSEADVTATIDQNLLDSAIDWAFSEPHPVRLRRTRAVVVVHRGQIVGERYAPPFDQHTPLLGWSMTKSVVHALVGILIKEGKLSLTDTVQAPEWPESSNGRSAITVDHLLQMTSGIEFDENYTNPLADVTRMLLRTPDMASYAANKKLVAEPGSQWSYSSGTTNILSRVMRRAIGNSDYHSFPHRALFQPLGMKNAVLEPDASGTFVGSSYVYATARDWAKFGLLYLQDGMWNGQRMLPEGWVRHATTPASSIQGNAFGAHFWLEIPDEYTSGGDATLLPQDAFHAVGHAGQFITVIPSRELVVIRLGLSRHASAWQHDIFLNKLLVALNN